MKSTTLGTIPPTLLVLLGALVILLTGAPAALYAQSTPSISVELSPGQHVPHTVALTGEVTLSNLAPADYSTVTLRADVTGHEDRTSHCYGEDTGNDIELAVDESLEAVALRLFKPCTNAPGGFGTYDYALTISVSRADPMQPGDTIELVSMHVPFLVSTYLTPGEQTLPAPDPSALAWFDPDPRTPAMYVGEWRQFRFRTDISRYAEDHLNVYVDPGDPGDFFARGGGDHPPGSAEEACNDSHPAQNWRRAIHQPLWVVACRPGPAVFWLTHEILGVPPLYTYEFEVYEADDDTDDRDGGPIGGGPAPGGGAAPLPSGPTPSEADFGWTVDRDIDALDAGNDEATGLWGDGETIWVAQNSDGGGDSVYAYDLASGERLEEREFELDGANLAPRGLWSNGETIWVSDSGKEKLFAHDLESGERLPAGDIKLSDANDDPRGIWSDRTTIWVLDDRDESVYLYDLVSGEQTAVYELDSANDDPHGIWSDGVGVWVSDGRARKLLAYRLKDGALVREGAEDFRKLTPARNNSPRGIWSDGDVMYVVDAADARIYSYNMPDAADARLASLTLSHIDIGEFSPGRREYTGILTGGAGKTVIEASPVQPGATVAIVPSDVDGDLENGHQAAVDAGTEVRLTVTSVDGSRRRVYRVRVEVPPCLDGLGEDFGLVTYEGGGIAQLEGCVRRLSVRAVYAWDGSAYVSYILDAPAFVNEAFVALFEGGIAHGTQLLARREPQPPQAQTPSESSP